MLKELAREYPRFGVRRLHQMLLREGMRINLKRVRRLCILNHLTLKVRKNRKRRGIGIKPPVLAEYRNHVWAYDFVHDQCQNGRQLKILTVCDEFTRECLAIDVKHRQSARSVKETLLKLFKERGNPEYVRSDNGPEFIARTLKKMLSQQNIKCKHIEPGSPWQNGKLERFNGILRDECANMETFYQREHAQAVSELFRRYYNTRRPHSSLGYLTPEEFAMRYGGACASAESGPNSAIAQGAMSDQQKTGSDCVMNNACR